MLNLAGFLQPAAYIEGEMYRNTCRCSWLGVYVGEFFGMICGDISREGWFECFAVIAICRRVRAK